MGHGPAEQVRVAALTAIRFDSRNKTARTMSSARTQIVVRLMILIIPVVLVLVPLGCSRSLPSLPVAVSADKPPPDPADRGAQPYRPRPADTLTFATDIAPIIYEHCSICHRPGESAPFDLLSYKDVKKRASQIVKVTHDRFMPPWLPSPGYAEFEDQRGLDSDQIGMLAQWAAEGAAEGNTADLPPKRSFSDDWQLGEPDLIVTMDRPYTLAAEGRDVYRNFVISVPVKQPRYVRAVELRPGNKRIVHHAILEADQTGLSRRLDDQDAAAGFSGMNFEGAGAESIDGRYIVWTPGRRPYVEPPGMAWLLQPDMDLVLQLHLQPSGKPEQIQPSFGLYFTDEPPSRHPFAIILRSPVIDIPPGKKDYRVGDRFVTPVDVQALAVFPHAHYLGKDMQVFATLPDGSGRWLIRIKDWDFNWQDAYRYRQPVLLPAGSTITMHYTYDNSADNKRNPFDPPRRVVAGNESTDEMATLTLQLLPVSEGDRGRLKAAFFQSRIEVDPNDWPSRYNIANLAFRRGDFDKAIHLYREALRINPEFAKAHYNLAITLGRTGAVEAAMHHYREAIRINPGFFEVYLNLGNLLGSMQRTDEAIEQFHKALKIKNDDAHAHHNLGVALRSQGNLDEAIKQFREALRIDPNFIPARRSLDAILATRTRQ